MPSIIMDRSEKWKVDLLGSRKGRRAGCLSCLVALVPASGLKKIRVTRPPAQARLLERKHPITASLFCQETDWGVSLAHYLLYHIMDNTVRDFGGSLSILGLQVLRFYPFYIAGRQTDRQQTVFKQIEILCR